MEETLPSVVENLSFRELNHLCATNSSFREICEGDVVWQTLYLRDFGPLVNLGKEPRADPVSWKLEYLFRKTETLYLVNVMKLVSLLILPEHGGAIKWVSFESTATGCLLLTTLGEVYDSHGEFQQNTTVNLHFERILEFDFRVIQLASGAKTILALNENGQAFISEDFHGKFHLVPVTLPNPVRKIWGFYGYYFLLTMDD